MKSMVVFIMTILLPTLSFGMELSLEDIQGGSEERVTFRKIDEGEVFSFTVAKSDPTDTGAIRVWNAPKGSQFQAGVFSWTPSSDQSGMYNVSFSALDPATVQPVFATIRIVVDNTRFSIRYNKTFEYLFTATDPDGDPVEITATGLPQGATFTGGQFTPKVFTWRPTRQQLGNHQMMITATDSPADGGQPKQDVSIIHIKVTRQAVKVGGQEIELGDLMMLASNWLCEDEGEYAS